VALHEAVTDVAAWPLGVVMPQPYGVRSSWCPPRECLRCRLPPRCTRRERNLALARGAVMERPFYVRMWPIAVHSPSGGMSAAGGRRHTSPEVITPAAGILTRSGAGSRDGLWCRLLVGLQAALVAEIELQLVVARPASYMQSRSGGGLVLTMSGITASHSLDRPQCLSHLDRRRVGADLA
jgi:hypothetical protein